MTSAQNVNNSSNQKTLCNITYMMIMDPHNELYSIYNNAMTSYSQASLYILGNTPLSQNLSSLLEYIPP